MKSLYWYLLGFCDFSFPADRRTAVLDYFLAHGIGTLSFRVEGEEGQVRLLRRDLGRLDPALPLTPLAEGGLPARLSALAHRAGLLLGIFLGALLLILSSLTVWRVEVSGNERIGSLEIEEMLAEAGLSVGALVPRVDTAAVRVRLLRDNPEISWIGVYIRGTTVAVEVRERVTVQENSSEGGLSNLVAAYDAVIESIRVDTGRAAVGIGQTVKAGDLLISGIYGTAGGVTAARATGEVRGRCERVFRVQQPLTVTEKEYERERLSGLSLTFFQKDIKLFQKADKSTEKYDIIKRKEQVKLFGRLSLPLFYTAEYRMPYIEVERTLTEDEAVSSAFAAMQTELAAALTQAELLRKEMVGEFCDEGYRLFCHTEFIQEISVPLEYGTE